MTSSTCSLAETSRTYATSSGHLERVIDELSRQCFRPSVHGSEVALKFRESRHSVAERGTLGASSSGTQVAGEAAVRAPGTASGHLSPQPGVRLGAVGVACAAPRGRGRAGAAWLVEGEAHPVDRLNLYQHVISQDVGWAEAR